MTGYRHNPIVAAVLKRFPGAEIVDVRHNEIQRREKTAAGVIVSGEVEKRASGLPSGSDLAGEGVEP